MDFKAKKRIWAYGKVHRSDQLRQFSDKNCRFLLKLSFEAANGLTRCSLQHFFYLSEPFPAGKLPVFTEKIYEKLY